MAISMATIKSMLDSIDDEIDTMKSVPFIGSFASPLAAVLDPIRKAVDAGAVDAVRYAIDAFRVQVDAAAKFPFIGGFISGIASIVDSVDAYIDQIDPPAVAKAKS